MSQKIGNLFNGLVLTGIALPLGYSAGTLTALIAHGLRIAVEHEPDGYGKRVHLTSPLLKFENDPTYLVTRSVYDAQQSLFYYPFSDFCEFATSRLQFNHEWNSCIGRLE